MNFLREQVDDMDRETSEAAALSHHEFVGSSSSQSSSTESTPLLPGSQAGLSDKTSSTVGASYSAIAMKNPATTDAGTISQENQLTLTTEMKEEINVWKKAQDSVQGDEATVRKVLQTKVVALESMLRKKLRTNPPKDDQFLENLVSLEKKYKIKNRELLVKAGVVMFLVIVLFFAQSLPFMHLSLGWISIFGAITLLVLADIEDIETVFVKVEWSTLVFFACLFVVMEALTEMRLLEAVGHATLLAISSFSPSWQLFMAITIVLWVSALASSFIDNIPFATVVVKVLLDMSHSDSLSVPLEPLVYALAFGACLGGKRKLCQL